VDVGSNDADVEVQSAASVPLAWSWRAMSWSVATSRDGKWPGVLAIRQLADNTDVSRMRTLPLCWSWRADRWQRASGESVTVPDPTDVGFPGTADPGMGSLTAEPGEHIELPQRRPLP
jgi:hypothetical protein